MKSRGLLVAAATVGLCAGLAFAESIFWDFNTRSDADVRAEQAGDGSNNGTIVVNWNPGGWWTSTNIGGKWDGPGWFFRLGHYLDITDQTHFTIDLKGAFGSGEDTGFTFIPETRNWHGGTEYDWGGWIWTPCDIPDTPEWTTYEIPMDPSDFSCWAGSWDGVMGNLDRLWMYFMPDPCSFDNVGWVNRDGLLPGDADMDGQVDLDDLGNLVANYGRTHYAPWDHGDFNDDGNVDLGDLGMLAGNFGATTPPSAAAPAPITTALLATGSMTVICKRRRRTAGVRQ